MSDSPDFEFTSGMEERWITDELERDASQNNCQGYHSRSRSSRPDLDLLTVSDNTNHNHRSPSNTPESHFAQQSNTLKRTQVRESRFKPRAARTKRLSMFPQLLSKISTLVETWTRMMGKTHEALKRGGQMVIKEALCCFRYLDGYFVQEIYHVSVCLYFQLPLLHLFKLKINIPSTT